MSLVKWKNKKIEKINLHPSEVREILEDAVREELRPKEKENIASFNISLNPDGSADLYPVYYKED